MSKKVGASAFSKDKEYRYDVKNPEGVVIGEIVLNAFKQPVLDRYREIRNGNGRSKGSIPKARAYLFEKTYSRFEFAEKDCELDLGECRTEVDFFLTNCLMTVDAIIIQHLAEVFPDVDPKE